MTGAPSQFEPELREFDAAEAPSNAVVFYGSSSLRLWDDLAERFPGRTVVNRGFGGSTLAECIDLLPRVVFPPSSRLPSFSMPGTMIWTRVARRNMSFIFSRDL